MEMVLHTCGNWPLEGKRCVFIHAATCDAELRDTIISQVLGFGDGQTYDVWYANDPEEVFSHLDAPAVQGALAFLPLVTHDYLALCESHGAVAGNRAPSFLEELESQGVAVLPVFAGAGTIAEFERLFGNANGVFLTNPEAIRFIELKLERLLAAGEQPEPAKAKPFASSLFQRLSAAARRLRKRRRCTDGAYSQGTVNSTVSFVPHNCQNG